MKSKYARILSLSILLGLSGMASAGEVTIGEGPYPPEPEVPSVTSRTQVAFELRQAQRLGLISIGEADSDFGTLQPASTKTRAQVIAELREAQRLGLVNAGGEGDAPTASAAQERQIVDAGIRARQQSRVIAG
jgi:hypothetical protein